MKYTNRVLIGDMVRLFLCIKIYTTFKITLTMNPLPLCPRLQLRSPIYVEQIIYMEGCGNYTTVYLKNGQRITLSKTIVLFERLLPRAQFIRLNKTYLVGRDVVQAWRYCNAKSLSVQLTNDLTVEVARRRVAQVRRVLLSQSTVSNNNFIQQ